MTTIQINKRMTFSEENYSFGMANPYSNRKSVGDLKRAIKGGSVVILYALYICVCICTAWPHKNVKVIIIGHTL